MVKSMKKYILLVSLGVLGLLVLLGSPQLISAQQLPGQLRSIGVDASKASIPLDQILSGGPPPNGIPALGFQEDWQGASPATNQATFISQEEASEWLGAREPVIAFFVNGEAKAYPLQILTWHEIVNDTVGGVPVAVTFCPLCNSALAFDRRLPLTQASLDETLSLNGAMQLAEPDEAFLAAYALQGDDAESIVQTSEITFGVSGALYNSNMLMFDNQTSTLWSQLLGVGVLGALNEVRLLRYPAQIVSFEEFQEAFPDAPVLSRDTGFNRRYGSNPYVGYDDIDSPAFLFRGEADGRLPPKARVVSVESPSEDVAYPFEAIAASGVINDVVGDMPVTLFWQEGTASALDTGSIESGRDVGSVGIFSRDLDGQVLTFERTESGFIDAETGSEWNILGQAVSGELAGQQLTPVVHDNTLWFAWAAFKPDTRIYSN